MSDRDEREALRRFSARSAEPVKQTGKDIAAALEAHDNGSLAWREARIAFLARKNDAEFIETFCRLLAAYYGDEGSLRECVCGQPIPQDWPSHFCPSCDDAGSAAAPSRTPDHE